MYTCTHVCIYTFVYACALIGYMCIAYLKDRLAASENKATMNPRKYTPIILHILTHMCTAYTQLTKSLHLQYTWSMYNKTWAHGI